MKDLTKEEALQKIEELKAFIEKEDKPKTYDDVAREMFYNKRNYYTTYHDVVDSIVVKDSFSSSIYSTTELQQRKLQAINKLMNVAKYLNEGWVFEKGKPGTYICESLRFQQIDKNAGEIFFKDEDTAKQAIQILGEETIKLALTQNY